MKAFLIQLFITSAKFPLVSPDIIYTFCKVESFTISRHHKNLIIIPNWFAIMTNTCRARHCSTNSGSLFRTVRATRWWPRCGCPPSPRRTPASPPRTRSSCAPAAPPAAAPTARNQTARTETCRAAAAPPPGRATSASCRGCPARP